MTPIVYPPQPRDESEDSGALGLHLNIAAAASFQAMEKSLLEPTNVEDLGGKS